MIIGLLVNCIVQSDRITEPTFRIKSQIYGARHVKSCAKPEFSNNHRTLLKMSSAQIIPCRAKAPGFEIRWRDSL